MAHSACCCCHSVPPSRERWSCVGSRSSATTTSTTTTRTTHSLSYCRTVSDHSSKDTSGLSCRFLLLIYSEDIRPSVIDIFSIGLFIYIQVPLTEEFIHIEFRLPPVWVTRSPRQNQTKRCYIRIGLFLCLQKPLGLRLLVIFSQLSQVWIAISSQSCSLD